MNAQSAAALLGASATERAIWRLLEDVPDPEIPIISVVDLGIIRHVRSGPDGVVVGVSPTYTGCPATEVIQGAIKTKLQDAGYANVRVETVLAPAWTSEWLTDAARDKLREYGIAPPVRAVIRHCLAKDPAGRPALAELAAISEFASTPCKALYRCTACLEPFEYFKCI